MRCPNCGHEFGHPLDNADCDVHPVPPELAELTYAHDKALRENWPRLIASWRRAFPGVDIAAEIRKAHAWEMSNPKQRKVNKARFLFNWLSKAQDRPRARQWPRPSIF